MENVFERLKASKAVRLAFALALVAGLWPATSLAAPRPAYADDSAAPSVDVEGYVKAQADSGKVGEEKAGFLFWGGQELHGTGKYLTVKHTYAQNLEEGDTISSIMTDAEECGEKVIAMYPSVEQLYEVDGNADYFVAFADSSAQNGTSSRAVDFQAAIMNNLGMSVEGVEYDAETGLVYIPKSLYGYDDIAAQGLQVQLLEPSSLEEGKAAGVEVSVDNRNGSVTVPEKVQSVEADAFDTTISVRIATEQTASAISIDDIEVTADDDNVNYAKQTDGLAKSASYDKSTGVLTVAASPAATASLQVTVKGSGIGSLLAPQKAYAAYDTPGTMATLPDVQFDNMDPDSLSIGEKFWYSANTMYYGEAGFNTDLRGYMCIPYQQSYGGGALDWHNNDTANWMAGGNVYGNEDLYYHFSGESYGGGYNDIDTCVLQVAMIDGTVTGDQGHSVDFSHSGSLWSSHGWNEQLSLYCAHIDVTGGGNGAPGTRPTFARVLAKGDDYVVLAFLTSEVYTQTGFSAYKFKVQSKGDLEVQKSSGNPEITDGNPCYSLEGATFDVYDSGWAYVTTIATDSNGYGKAEGLKAGRYFLKETAAPKGYLVNADWEAAGGSDWVTVPGGGTGHVDCVDEPGNDPDGVLLQKVDAETGEKVAQGSASLALAEYTFEYYEGYYQTADEAKASGEPERTWVMRTNENGFTAIAYGDMSFDSNGNSFPYKVSGDDFYRSTIDTIITVPLGTVVAHESKAPEGYNLSDKVFVSRVVMDASGNVTTEGDQLAIDGNTGKPETVAAEQPKRGDLQFSKRDQDSMKRMAGVPFLVTSKTTGERHVLVTDANGQFDSSAFTSADSCNANDSALTGDAESGFSVDESKLDASSGVWFGSDASRGAAGAFPYDEYSLEELPCSANEGKQLVHDGFAVWRDANKVDLGTIDDTTPVPATSAKSGSTGEKSLCVSPAESVVDYVNMSGLVKGDAYKLVTYFKDASDGSAVPLAGGAESVDTAFTADASSMTVKTSASVDTTKLGGHSIVACQAVYDSRGRLLVTHDDLCDESETLPVHAPEIGTQAADALDGDKMVIAMPGAEIVDAVGYSRLAVGYEYTLSASLRYADTGEPVVDAQGKEVAGTATFTPEATSGTAKVKLGFDAAGLDTSRKLVVFEKLYAGDDLLTSHEDKDDAGQTVTPVIPYIGTVAADGFDGDKNVVAMPNATIVDTVEYDGVAAGVEHELRAALKYKDTGEAVKDAKTGEPVTATAKFTPELSRGKAKVTFSFDGTGIADGSALVVAERLYVAGEAIADHDDLNDEDQTVRVAQPKISTTAADGHDGDDVVSAGATSTIVDAVAYENLRPGEAYKVSGKLVWKADGSPVVDAKGQGVSASAEFTPQAAFGAVDVTFTFDASGVAEDGQAVCFESLTFEGEEIAKHADIDDESQTTTIAVPWASTSAADAVDGDHVVAVDPHAEVVDTVEFGNAPGADLTAWAILMDKESGLPLLPGIPADDEAAYPADDAGAEMSVAEWWAGVLEALGAEQTTVEVPGEAAGAPCGFEYWDDAAQAWKAFGGDGAQVKVTGSGSATATGADGSEWTLAPAEPGAAAAWTITVRHADGTSESIALAPEWLRQSSGATVERSALSCRGVKDSSAVEAAWNAVPRYAAAAVTGSAGIPAAEAGSVDVSLGLDASGLADRSAVVFELLCRDAGEGSFEAVATHADASDEAQSVYFDDAHIGTTAVDATDGDHKAIASTTTRITDTVRYEGLVPGVEHTMAGALYDKATGEPIKDAKTGEPVTASTTFTPESADGSVEVEFTFDSTSIAGSSAVAFEKCWRADFMCAEHSDLTDTDQTVEILAPPSGGIWDKTGGVLPIAAAAIAAMVAGAGALLAYGRRQSKKAREPYAGLFPDLKGGGR